MPKYPKFSPMAIVTHQAMKESGGVPSQVPMLTACNYTSWSIKMEAIMDAQGVWETIEPQGDADVDVKKSKVARAFIFQAVPEDVLLQIAKKKSAKEVWESLRTRYLGADRVQKARLQTLKGDFEMLRMKEGEAIDEFAGKLSSMAAKYSSLGATLDDETLVRKLLNSVPDKFLQLVASIEQYSDIESMPFEEAIGRMKAYEERIKPRNGSPNRQLLLTHTEWQERQKQGGSESPSNGRGYKPVTSEGRGGHRGRGRGNRGRGRNSRGGRTGAREDANRSNGKARDKSHIKCFNCQSYGHFASECTNPRRKEEEANLIRTQEDEPALLMLTCMEEKCAKPQMKENKEVPARNSTNRGQGEETWYLDNGASNHMTGNLSHFVELDRRINGWVRFGDNSKVEIMGKGSILLQCKNGEQRLITEVYYIPNLCHNILSLGQVTEEGCKVEMLGQHLYMYDREGRLLIKVQRTNNRLYKVNLHSTEPVCLSVRLDEEAWLWHARLGHLNFQAMKDMVTKEMVQGVPETKHPTQICEGCLVAKQHRKSFPLQSHYRAAKPLELVHADLCGPITPSTSAGNRYFFLLVDDYSRYMWCYVIRTKDEAFETFKKFKARVEKEGNHKLKALRTDRGGEFTSRNFENFCEEEGVRRYLTAPYSPQQNGVVERRNQTIMATTRSLLKTMGMPGCFWGEAVRHSVFLLNRMPTKAVEAVTPYEAWKGRKPNLSHLRVFGCLAHMRIPSKNQDKLSDRSKQMVHLGIEPGSKAYRLYDPLQGKLAVSRDVIFEETQKWDWGKTERSSKVFTPEEIRLPMLEEEVSQLPDPTELNVPTDHGERIEEENTGSTGEKPAATSHFPPDTGDALDNSPFDHTPTRGFGSLADIYARSQPVELEPEQLMLAEDEPSSYQEAAGNRKWEEAMQQELESIEHNATWRLTQLPSSHKPIGLKWVYKAKKDPAGNVIKHKARLVAKGYVQRKGVDFEEVFAPVARMETVRLLLALSAQKGWQVHHLDVKSAFLHGELQEEVYVCQPEGFQVKGKEEMVYRLNKALYGLKQAPRAWNTRLDQALKRIGFHRCPQEQAVYKKHKRGESLIVGVYVDDLIVTGTRAEEINIFKQQMREEFEMSDLGILSFYLGIEVQQSDEGITLNQAGYAKKVLQLGGMQDCNPSLYPMEAKLQLTKEGEGDPVDATGYRQLIGSLRYLTHTRPDLAYSVGIVSRYMESPKQNHLLAVKHILRYIKGTIHYGLKYCRGGEGKVLGFSDSNLAGDVDDRKSTSGTIFYFSSSPITWCSQKQKTVALSSCEAEFMAATTAACQAIWLRGLLSDLTDQPAQQVQLRVDNKSAIALMKNPVFHGRSKHIDTRFHFIRECIENGHITVEHVDGSHQCADILTKALARVKFAEMRELVGVRDLRESCQDQGGECYN